MTLVESRPNEWVRLKLEFLKPFATRGKKLFISKVMCLFMNMDKMIGGQFERGFASLKTIVEGTPNT